eukprot:TRINITY_DN12567_c0_g1_i1.p2 TRINITY_DN12567_c0_g1~~TRINITY_DN12567_c0_g1_i1.p2  ORF type:complete len:502 (-),score=110.68 TRINITY_DN12567_c0_g1_i1:52-1488(-)
MFCDECKTPQPADVTFEDRSDAAPVRSATRALPRPPRPRDSDMDLDAKADVDDGSGSDRGDPGRSRKRARTGAVWQWQDNDGKWSGYDADTSAKLESAQRRGETKVMLGGSRFVDLGDMTQRRSDNTLSRRAVRRLGDAAPALLGGAGGGAAAGPARIKGARWLWKDDTGAWVAYPGETAAALEAARSAGQSRCAVDAQRYVDLRAMEQRRSDDSLKWRAVRREVPGGDGAPAAPAPAPAVRASPYFAPGPARSQTGLAAAGGRVAASTASASDADVPPGQGVWFWKDDSGAAVPYDAGISALIEAAYARGTERINIDEHRVVDIKLRLQRRREDPNRIRSVVRRGRAAVEAAGDRDGARAATVVVGAAGGGASVGGAGGGFTERSPLFAHCVFALLGRVAPSFVEAVDLIEEHGGMAAAAVFERVTHVVCPSEDADTQGAALAVAAKLGIPAVTPAYVSECVAQNSVLPTRLFRLVV